MIKRNLIEERKVPIGDASTTKRVSRSTEKLRCQLKALFFCLRNRIFSYLSFSRLFKNSFLVLLLANFLFVIAKTCKLFTSNRKICKFLRKTTKKMVQYGTSLAKPAKKLRIFTRWPSPYKKKLFFSLFFVLFSKYENVNEIFFYCFSSLI